MLLGDEEEEFQRSERRGKGKGKIMIHITSNSIDIPNHLLKQHFYEGTFFEGVEGAIRDELAVLSTEVKSLILQKINVNQKDYGSVVAKS